MSASSTRVHTIYDLNSLRKRSNIDSTRTFSNNNFICLSQEGKDRRYRLSIILPHLQLRFSRRPSDLYDWGCPPEELTPYQDKNLHQLLHLDIVSINLHATSDFRISRTRKSGTLVGQLALINPHVQDGRCDIMSWMRVSIHTSPSFRWSCPRKTWGGRDFPMQSGESCESEMRLTVE